MFGSQADRGGPNPRPTAVEVHSLPADVSLRQLRDLINQGSPGQVLQSIAALDSSEHGVALIILSSESSAVRAVELFDGYPLSGTYLHVKRADSLPGSLVNLLYSLEQAPTAAETATAQANAAAAYLEQQQQHEYMQQAENRRVQQAQQDVQEAWDAAQRQQKQQREAHAAASTWSRFDRAPSQPNGMPPSNGHTHGQQNGGNGSYAQHPSQQQVESDLMQLQLDQQQRQQQQQQAATAAAAAAAAGLPPLQPASQQQQRPGAMSWASAAAAAPSLAALGARPQTVAASLAAAGSAAGSGSGLSSDDWQAAGSRGRTGRRDGQAGDAGGRAGSSVSSGSPRPSGRSSSGRRSDDKQSRPGGQDGASLEPTTKLWMGGIDGTASAETVRAVFGRFGPIYDYELQPATHEKGRTDQWGFVNFKRLSDATRAYQALVGEVIPELTGTRKLKLQFRPVDNRRSATAGGRK